MNQIFNEPDIFTIIIKKINGSDLEKIYFSQKNKSEILDEYMTYYKYLHSFIMNIFTDNINSDIYDLLGINLKKFKFINLGEINLTDSYNIYRNNEIYEKYESDYLFIKFKLDGETRVNIYMRLFNKTFGEYDHFQMSDIDSDNHSFAYTNSLDNIILKQNDLIKNHTYTCGCSKIFTCQNNGINLICNNVLSNLIV